MSHCNKKMLSFFLTTKCNLCCRYCYNAKERNFLEDIRVKNVDEINTVNELNRENEREKFSLRKRRILIWDL